jgi:hypothetical protein
MMRDREKVKLLVATLKAVRGWIDSTSAHVNFYSTDEVFKRIDETLAKVEEKNANRKDL